MKISEDLCRNMQNFSKINEQFRVAFENAEKNQNLSESEKYENLFHYLSLELFLYPQYFEQIAEEFSTELPKLLNTALFNKEDQVDNHRHILNCVLLGNILRKRRDLEGYALKYFNSHPSGFENEYSDLIKKRISPLEITVGDLEIVDFSYSLLKSNPDFYRIKWNWSVFIGKYLEHEEAQVRWLTCQTVAILYGMNEGRAEKLIQSRVSPNLATKFDCALASQLSVFESPLEPPPLNKMPWLPRPEERYDDLINISGVYIPVVRASSIINTSLIEVPSTCNNLRKIALGLTLNRAVCLQGPVGSGKTSLLEYLALKTGRKLGENFIKLQLGDETDSKMLLGTYRCTDIPGEFIWQPGVLTQAVLEGNWLLLEDIDSASMDIASLLSSLLENGNLTIPGYRDAVPITPGFQLFLTQRFLSTITGHHKKNSNSMLLLEKKMLQINVDPLTVEELKQILESNFKELRTITDRMLNVFLLFHKNSSDSSQISIPSSGRLISTRDFFKWCSRAIIDFDIKSQASALKVLQDAIDVFCCSYSNSEEALNLAKQISTNLGIINQKAEYFFRSYKPTMKLTTDSFIAGRAILKRENNQYTKMEKYSFTRPSAVLLERIMCCIHLREPVLLVGETGTGKTSCVQYLAHTVGQKLIVINMNQQSDSADLLGGFKPIDLKIIISPVRKEFEEVFVDYFRLDLNRKYLNNIAASFSNQKWSDVVRLMIKSYRAAIRRLSKSIYDFKSGIINDISAQKIDKDTKFLDRWQKVGQKLLKLDIQLKHKTALAFAFIKGSLVTAVENGYWVLLDEINLANAETLECLSGLLDGSQGSLCLLERGDKQPVKRHNNFTLFACMNPSTDVGKKDLPAGLRNRFTEFFVDELNEKNDLLLLVNNYLDAMSLKERQQEDIVNFYLKVRREMVTNLSDGLGHRPHFSLRSLCRALMIASKNPCGMFKRSLYEAFSLSFLTQLDSRSYQVVEKMISSYLLGDDKTIKAVLNQPIPEPNSKNNEFLQFEGYWVKTGSYEPSSPEDYILTKLVRRNLKDLVRVVSIGKLPVLLQGDTSVGKTSLISYLAKASGNKCVRINNHEHTDLQEYIGSYVADIEGKLVFREGLLVEAMRKGHWIILDELNLAPSDVLEALNRVLDDNRELFIPETQETVKANPNFMLFATQNPPGSYGGRKMLSRAFRNRFVELHFNEIPPEELEFILHKRCHMGSSHAKKMINVMTDLQMRRRGSVAFAGKQGFITLRDLFRWGERYRLAQNKNNLYDWDQHIADEGYLVLAGRVRKTEEKHEIIEVLQKHLKRKVVPDNLFTLSSTTSTVTKHILEKIDQKKAEYGNIVWTYNMRQLAVMVSKAMEFKEPVLLVGETGGGKTTICKLIAENNGQQLITVNCHMHTESSDFIGGLRPVRDHSDEASKKLFEWVDGPLIHALIQGEVFLVDEISLADDSVLERLNSLLEPERSLLLAEKGIDLNNPENSELITANANFHFIGTMNPGGDFGKKELSPALRNRFTEIWCESCRIRVDLVAIVEQNVRSGISMGNQQDGSSGVGNAIMDFIEWFEKTEVGKRLTISIRDILTWVTFLNTCVDKMDISEAYIHGAYLTFLDSLGSGTTSIESLKHLELFRNNCQQFLTNQVSHLGLTQSTSLKTELTVEKIGNKFGINPFYVDIGPESPTTIEFSFNAPTTLFNLLRLLRGMQLNKAILLEGSPGVGKTSLVTALAKFTGHQLYRVNLSDQTDISDLFGADLPAEGGTGGHFSWRDGPLLQALKNGSWILLDELNLASQSVLEGLNACLDHRGEIYIPELGKTFFVQPGTKFFGCQNPLKQGGCRRGLPQSFLNRFIQVYVNSLTDRDLHHILSNQFNHLPSEIITKMIEFNTRIANELNSHSFGNKGAPWECNLRDLTRWCEAMIYHFKLNSTSNRQYQPESVMNLIYGNRMRTVLDKTRVEELFMEVFSCKVRGSCPILYVSKRDLYIGDVCLERSNRGVNVNVLKQEKTGLVLRSQLSVLRSLAYCVNLNWMTILVGNSGCGKSSVVKTLAVLAGKTLKTLPVTSAMDTTDILGGFEQTNYSRHLDEIAKEAERLSFEAIQELLIGKRTEEAIDLISRWEAYRDLKDTKNYTLEEETKLFHRKSEKLQDIFEILKKTASLETITTYEYLQGNLTEVTKAVKGEGSLNAGGKFEWVDSVLVKCLQNGSWLLVDNVNLCSSAVLDRLNALLEPNGVLAVSERGVDSSGNIIEIRPHKDFRMFFTMDPKNGEISRAMRNRGIEIYMFDINESSNSKFDIMSLINHEGLQSTNQIMILMNIHTFISQLILGEKPTIKELLQVSSLIAQQQTCNISLFETFFGTFIDVYFKTRSPTEFDSNDPVTAIKEEIEKNFVEYNIMGSSTKVAHTDMFDNAITLKTQNIETCSTIEKVKQQSTMILTYLSNSSCTDFDKVHSLLNFFSITSLEDLDTRLVYIKSKLVDKNYLHLIENFCHIISELKNESNSSLPLDHNWLPYTSYQRNNSLFSNKLNLMLLMAAHSFLERTEVEGRKSNKKAVALLDYMLEKEQKTIEDKFNDIIVNNYLTLIKRFDTYLWNLPSRISDITDEKVIRIMHLIFWRFIFHKCSLKNIKKLSPTKQHGVLVNLSIHYKWFYKYSIRQLVKITNVDLPNDLEEIVEAINSKLDQHFSVLQKFGRYYQKNTSRTPPFISHYQLELVSKYNNLKRCYDLGQKGNDVANILAIFKSNKKLRNFLVGIRSKLKYNFTDVSEDIDLLKMEHEKCISENIKEISRFELELVPVLDVLTQLEIKSEEIGNHANTFENNILVPTDFCGTVALYQHTKDNRLLHDLTKLYYLYLINSASARPNQYLSRTDGKEITLSGFNPKVTYFITTLLVDIQKTENSGSITLGNFRALMKQHDTLSFILWRNFHQFSEKKYDYLRCEITNITRVHNHFIQEVSRTLKIGLAQDDTSHSSTLKLIESLKKMEGMNKPSDHKEMYKFTNHLQNCCMNLKKLENSISNNEKILTVSDLYMEMGFLKAILNSKLSPIDPLVKKILKRQYCTKATEVFESMKKCYEWQNEIYSNSVETIHAYCEPLKAMIGELEIKNEKLSEYVAVRPESVAYESIFRVVKHAFNTILSEDNVTKTISSLNHSILKILTAHSEKADIDYKVVSDLARQETSVVIYENLIHEWSLYESSYPDIIEPLLSSIAEFFYGLKMKLSLLKKCLAEYKYMKCGININEDLLNLVKLPIIDEKQSEYTSYLEKFTNKRINNFLDCVLEDADQPYIKDQENYRLLKCGIQETFNYCLIEAKSADGLNKNPFLQFSNIINTFVNAYNKQQQKKELEKKEAESLYKLKTKLEDRTEEEQIEEDLKDLFPNYHSIDFTDFQENPNLSEPPEELRSDMKFDEIISYKDLAEVVKLHITLMRNFTRNEWLNPSKNKQVTHDFLVPFMEKFKSFTQILDRSVHSLDYTMDDRLIGSLNVLLAITKQYGDTHELSDQTSSPSRMVNKKTSDFYKDPNVEEVKSCYHILEELRMRVNELLNEWPEQPTLKTIILVIERISNFDIKSPISRFLTGFEILLTKCHEWEQVAHSGVSLSQHYHGLTAQIISWRKLELTMWKDLLNRTYDSLNEPLPKWWLYLFNIMKQFVLEKDFTERELIETLQTFITKSNLAEFHGRLDLIFTFHCHATYLDKTKKSEQFISILWNIYIYFQQFTLAVSNKIKDLRSPIEKKLKDYVKIVRWKDINYWAIKETVDKSHKTLHKYMREFKEVLQQPVLSCLSNTNSNNDGENVGIWDRPQRHSPKNYHYTLDPEAYMAKLSLVKKFSSSEVPTDETILSKAESYFLKSRKLCKQTILATQYPSLVRSLDGFVTEIIETSSHLQKLEVDTSLSKEKQKSQARSILQQKHRALADLFKALAKIGLSFRSGIIESKIKNPTSDFLLKPLDLNANFSHINYGSKEEKILTIWDSCEIYYVRSMMRGDVLEAAMNNPAKDLGLPNIERCKGFTMNLMMFTQKQKHDLVESSRLYYYLRYYAKQMNDLCESKQFLCVSIVNNLLDLLKKLTIIMNQYKIILNTCPAEQNFSSETSEIPILISDMEEFIKHKYDTLWTKASNLINTILNSSNKLNTYLLKCKGCVPAVDFELLLPKYISVSDINLVENELTGLSKDMNNLKRIFGNSAVTCSISWLNTEIDLIKQQLFEENPVENVDIDQFKKYVENFIEQILVVMQNIYKKYEESSSTDEIALVDEAKEDQLKEEQLKKLLVENLSSDIATLEMKNILRKTHKIARILLTTSPKCVDTLKTIVSQSLPLLEQLVHLYQYFITQQVSVYRVTCKMNCVLLNIFIDLASKGFCIPPEFSDEIEGEGVGKPSDGLGLGDGEGKKDVSDRIESEDQLDDAQPAGQEKEKDEEKDCKEEDKGIEMSEDFESKLQDKEKKEDDSENSSGDSDADDQMGDTEKGANQLDQEIWGSDQEDVNEDQEEGGSEQKDEKGEHGEKEGEDQLGAKDDTTNRDKEMRENSAYSEEKEKNKKDINELDESEIDDDQLDSHHGKQPELPEPEPMDLPDDLQLDDGEEKDNDTQEENPFDIDKMKEDNLLEDKHEKEDGDDYNKEPKNDDEKDFSSDDEDVNKEQPDISELDEGSSEEKEDKTKENIDKNEDTDEQDSEEQNNEETAMDHTQSRQENVEAMVVDDAEATDNTRSNQSENQQSNQPIEELCQEDRPDQEGVGQSQMEESTSGHTAQTTALPETKSTRQEPEEKEYRKQKPGESNSKRSLGDTEERLRKKLKTVDIKKDVEDITENEENRQEESSEIFQHIKDANEAETQILDVATKEQAESQKEAQSKEEKEEQTKSVKELPSEEEEDSLEVEDVPIDKPEKMKKTKESKSNKKHHPEGDILEDIEDIDIEGEVVETLTVPRSSESFHHTRFQIPETTFTRLSIEEIDNLRLDVEKQLLAWNEPPSTAEAEQAWHKISSITSSLAQDLSEQLRLVLEPTQASRLKGDFRTGRRINMRKVIPYIASQFRKDKIWLRRTKPSKREYQIVMAIDDSSSMADNHSKELAFESVALISKALTLLESGQLSVLSFGEKTEVVHKLTDQFTDKSGIKLLQKFQFIQNKTCIADLVDFATEMFNQSQIHSTAMNAKLLVIVSDGRGVFSQGEFYVKQAVRRAKLSNIFMVFVIIDNPENKNSVLDIKMPVFKDGKLLRIQSYMDVFPFSFYIILRDINSLPNVLSDALRQWFEVVSNLY
nr:midasin [Leptinotarsa decemlineata]